MAERPRILVVECMQEISSFNPVESGYESFHVERGNAMLGQEGLNTALGGALPVLRAAGLDPVPVYGARAGSAGPLSTTGWKRLSTELIAAFDAAAQEPFAGVYVSLHGAMGAVDERDPEGWLLTEIRRIVGETVPIVISMDLHGILTEKMLRQIDALAVYQTYPHVDFADTGRRAAALMARIVNEGVRPTIARVWIPALVRGDELITRTGCYGDLIREAQRLERDGTALAAAIFIGNPFTDVPELGCQVVVTTDDAPATASAEALRLAEEFWPQRFRMQGKLISLERALAQASTIDSPVVFTDAADATSSGATGDSNRILEGVRRARYKKRVLAQIVDPDAAAVAHRAGVGATVEVTLGGRLDPNRFTPMAVRARVRTLTDGTAKLETMGIGLDAGPTAVLTYENVTVVVFSKTLSLFDRAMYYASGLNPRDFDAILVKSPHTEHHMYDAWVEKNFNIDVPGATSANLPTLGHTVCRRPIFPLDEGVAFEPRVQLFRRAG